jgi:hypothetical protein
VRTLAAVLGEHRKELVGYDQRVDETIHPEAKLV